MQKSIYVIDKNWESTQIAHLSEYEIDALKAANHNNIYPFAIMWQYDNCYLFYCDDRDVYRINSDLTETDERKPPCFNRGDKRSPGRLKPPSKSRVLYESLSSNLYSNR